MAAPRRSSRRRGLARRSSRVTPVTQRRGRWGHGRPRRRLGQIDTPRLGILVSLASRHQVERFGRRQRGHPLRKGSRHMDGGGLQLSFGLSRFAAVIAGRRHSPPTSGHRVRLVKPPLLAFRQLHFSRQHDECRIGLDDFAGGIPVYRHQGQLLLRIPQLVPGNPDVVRGPQLALGERPSELLGREDVARLRLCPIARGRVVERIDDQRPLHRYGTALLVKEIESSTATTTRWLAGDALNGIRPDHHHLFWHFIGCLGTEP